MVLANCVQTRQKIKEAYDLHFAATIERAEKQIILAKYGRRLLNYLDDTPVVPGDVRQPFAHEIEARQILSDAEAELQQWRPNLEDVTSQSSNLGPNLMPAEGAEDVQTGGIAAPAPTHVDKPAAERQGTHLEDAVAA